MFSLKNTINLLVYLSAALGLVLLPQLYGLGPSWLFYSVVGGWLAYVVVSVLVRMGLAYAYHCAFALAILTLAISLPQPEHYALIESRLVLASVTFLAGSILQLMLVFLIPIHLWRVHFRHQARGKTSAN